MSATAIWSTRGLPRADVLDAWSSKLTEVHAGWALSFPEPDHFRASMRYRKVDHLTIADFRTGRVAGHLPASVRNGEPLIGVLINLSGRLVCRYVSGEEFVLEPGQIAIWDSENAKSFEAVEPHREFCLLLPRKHAPQGLTSTALRASGAIPAGPGSGLRAVAVAQLGAIARELDQISDAGLAIACQSLFDMLDTAMIAPCLSARTSLLLKVRQYIEDNLDDPGLYPSSIAAAHGISLRTLQLAFADTGTTVSRWIRDRRLKACYRELSQARRTETVTEVAFRWGFNDAAHFSRSFKQAFGTTPRSILNSARSQHPG